MEVDSIDTIDLLPTKDISSSTTVQQVYKFVPPVYYRLRNKDNAHIDKIRQTFSQGKINILLLDAIQQMPYARLLKDLCTTSGPNIRRLSQPLVLVLLFAIKFQCSIGTPIDLLFLQPQGTKSWTEHCMTQRLLSICYLHCV